MPTTPSTSNCGEPPPVGPSPRTVPPPPAFARGANDRNARAWRHQQHLQQLQQSQQALPHPPHRRHRQEPHAHSERNVVDLRRIGEETASEIPSSRGCEAPTKVLDFLFLGSVRDATNRDFLRCENIRTILNVSREEYWSADRCIVVHPFQIDDTTDANIGAFFEQTFLLLESARRAYYEALNHPNHTTSNTTSNSNNSNSNNSNIKSSSPSHSESPPRVLIHCQRGRSRSATIVIAYLIRRNGWTVAEALQYTAHRRPCVEPNIGFLDALRAYQSSIDTAERSRRCGALCLAVRNLSSRALSSAVHKFFEDHIGCVQEVRVMVHSARSPQTRAKDEAEADGGGGDANSLCLVCFAASECVRVARRMYAAQPEMFTEALGVLPGKKLRLTIPSKLIRLTRGEVP